MKINDVDIEELLNIKLMERSIQPPKPIVIKQSVPFLSGSYDFSKMGGEIFYEEREITCKFAIPTENTTLLHMVYSQLLDLTMTDIKLKIGFEDIPYYYFIGSVQNGPNFDEIAQFGTCTIQFMCYPFKICEFEEGNDIWDTFNFELDIFQNVEFDINGSKTITLYNNSSCGIDPIIQCTSTMTVIKGKQLYTFKAGTTQSWSLRLDKGINNLIVKGIGKIKFLWHKGIL